MKGYAKDELIQKIRRIVAKQQEEKARQNAQLAENTDY